MTTVATYTVLPFAGRDTAHLPGHLLLAKLGKKVLRPGGAELTKTMLRHLRLRGADVVELAPGLGATAADILEHRPHSYLGIERDRDAAVTVEAVLDGAGRCIVADAAATTLPDASADVVIGEAMLSMQTDRAKSAIMGEVRRVLRPGGRYAIHELALTPDDLTGEVKENVRTALARSAKVNARPLTVAEWELLCTEHGLRVERVDHAPVTLLEPRRLIADEGVIGAARLVWNLLRDGAARRRILSMRATFRRYRSLMTAVSIIAVKPT